MRRAPREGWFADFKPALERTNNGESVALQAWVDAELADDSEWVW
jgi:hypothetical protein